MNRTMLRISKNLKIFKRIVKLIAINMMNYFGGFKRSSKMFFYNISMFKDVSPVIRWMIGAKNSNVAMISDITSTLPIMGSPFRGFHLVCMVPILMLLVNLFICTQAEAKIFIKPFDQTGVKSLTDISDICGASEVIQRNAGDTAWECATVGTASASGDTNQVQYNGGSGVFAASPDFQWNNSTGILQLSGDISFVSSPVPANSDISTTNQTTNNKTASRLRLIAGNALGTAKGGSVL